MRLSEWNKIDWNSKTAIYNSDLLLHTALYQCDTSDHNRRIFVLARNNCNHVPNAARFVSSDSMTDNIASALGPRDY